METSNEVYAKLQNADNKQLWAIAKEIVSNRKKLSKLETEMTKVVSSNVDVNDKAQVRQIVLQHLLKESDKGNAQASDKLAKWAGIEEEKQDIIIEVVNYNPTDETEL